MPFNLQSWDFGPGVFARQIFIYVLLEKHANAKPSTLCDPNSLKQQFLPSALNAASSLELLELWGAPRDSHSALPNMGAHSVVQERFLLVFVLTCGTGSWSQFGSVVDREGPSPDLFLGNPSHKVGEDVMQRRNHALMAL